MTTVPWGATRTLRPKLNHAPKMTVGADWPLSPGARLGPLFASRPPGHLGTMEASPSAAEDPPMPTTAVIFERRGMIAFGPEIPADQLQVIRDLGGRVVEGVTLEAPLDVHHW